MAFQEEYEALEEEFRSQVARDNEELGIESSFVRNLRPEGPVDFVLIAMEPSTGARRKGARRLEEDLQPEYNFSRSTEDFILHSCIREYLCGEGQSYYLTDLSKGAIKTRQAGRKRQEKYERWYPLLRKELRLVAKPGARIIAIGNVVADFLADKGLCERVAKVLHYSPSAAGHREKAIQRWREDFSEYSQNIDGGALEKTARDILQEAYSEAEDRNLIERVIERRIREHKHGSKLMESESRKKLLFCYRNEFQDLRTASHIVLAHPDDWRAGGEGSKAIDGGSNPIVELVAGVEVRVKQSARAKDFRGRIGTVLSADVPGKGTQVEVNGVRKWMSSNNLEAVEDLSR